MHMFVSKLFANRKEFEASKGIRTTRTIVNWIHNCNSDFGKCVVLLSHKTQTQTNKFWWNDPSEAQTAKRVKMENLTIIKWFISLCGKYSSSVEWGRKNIAHGQNPTSCKSTITYRWTQCASTNKWCSKDRSQKIFKLAHV